MRAARGEQQAACREQAAEGASGKRLPLTVEREGLVLTAENAVAAFQTPAILPHLH